MNMLMKKIGGKMMDRDKEYKKKLKKFAEFLPKEVLERSDDIIKDLDIMFTMKSDEFGDINLKYQKPNKNRPKDKIYFIRAENNTLKIGTTYSVIKRLKAIQMCCPYKLEVIGVIYGGYVLEKQIHKDLEAFKTHGEWFELTDEVKEYLKKNYPLAKFKHL